MRNTYHTRNFSPFENKAPGGATLRDTRQLFILQVQDSFLSLCPHKIVLEVFLR